MPHLFLGGLRVRLLLLILLALVPIVGLTLYADSELRRVGVADAQTEAHEIAQTAAREQEQLIGTTQQSLRLLAQLPAVRAADSTACSTLFADAQKQYARLAELGAATPNGDVFCSAIPLTRPVNLANVPWFQQTLQTGAPVIGEYATGTLSRAAVLPLSYPVLDSAGKPQAVVFAGVNLSWLDQVAAQATLPPGGVLIVVDSSGTILARHPDPDKWVGKNMPDAPLVKAMMAQQSGAAEIQDVDGATRLFTFTYLNGVAPGLRIAIGVPPESISVEADRLLTRNLVGLGLIALLAFAAAWLGGEWFIRRPAQTLVRAAQHLAAGDLRVRSGVPRGAGELSELGRAFDQMAESLEQRTAERAHTEESLRASEERYRHISELISDYAYAFRVDPDGTLRGVWLTEAFTRVFGFTLPEIDARGGWQSMVHPEDISIALAHVRQVLSNRVDVSEFRFVTRSGEARWLRDYAQPIWDASQQRVTRIYGAAQDITERKRAGQEIQRRADEFAALYDVARDLAAQHDLTGMLEMIVERAIKLLDAHTSSIGLYDAAQEEVVLTVARGMRFPPGTRVKLGQGLAGQVALTRQTVIVDDYHSWEHRLPQREDEPITAALGVPLLYGGELIGVLMITETTARQFTDADVRLLTLFGEQTASAVHSARLLEQTAQRLDHLTALHAVDKVISSSLDLRVTLDALLEQVITQLRVDAVDVLLLNPHTLTLDFGGGRGFRTRNIERSHGKLGEGHAGAAALERRVVHIPNLPAAGAAFQRAALLADEEFITYAAGREGRGQGRARSLSPRGVHAGCGMARLSGDAGDPSRHRAGQRGTVSGVTALQHGTRAGVRRDDRGLVARARPAGQGDRRAHPARHGTDHDVGARGGRARRGARPCAPRRALARHRQDGHSRRDPAQARRAER